VICIFTKTTAKKGQADFENLQSQPRTPREKTAQPIKTIADRNASQKP